MNSTVQEDVKHTLEMLRNAGIRVWMLTGDKVETATCIAISAKLISRTQSIFTLCVKSKEDAWRLLNQFADEVLKHGFVETSLLC